MQALTPKQRIFSLVKQIPEARVSYFGLIGVYSGLGARTVGWILSGMPESEWELIPWYRVVAKSGYISSLKLGYKGIIQKTLLEAEGLHLVDDKVDMDKYLFTSFNS